MDKLLKMERTSRALSLQELLKCPLTAPCSAGSDAASCFLSTICSKLQAKKQKSCYQSITALVRVCNYSITAFTELLCYRTETSFTEMLQIKILQEHNNNALISFVHKIYVIYSERIPLIFKLRGTFSSSVNL